MEKNKRPGQDTMSSVIISMTRKMITETAQSVSAFATAQLIPALEIQELINIGSEGISADDYGKWRSRSIKRVQRIMDGDTPLPADWVLTWIASLPEPYKSQCRKKVAALQGLLWIPLPDYRPGRSDSIAADIDIITVKFGGVLADSQPAHDGFYDDSDDRKSLQKLQNRLMELQTHIKREIHNIEMATGIAAEDLVLARSSPLWGVPDVAV